MKNWTVRISVALTSFALLPINYGCVQKAPQEVQLEIQSIQQGESDGVYNLVGRTNLPDSSRIAVAAVRYLLPTQQQLGLSSFQDRQNRSILARQIVEVRQGQWQAELNLWQVAPDGRYQEAWQVNQAQLNLTPDEDITFIATFEPDSQLARSDQSNAVVAELDGRSLRFTNEGEKYIQASQNLTIPLPVGKTTPPRPLPEDLNDGWGNRYQVSVSPQVSQRTSLSSIKSRQTNAPLSSAQFLR